MSDFNDRIVCNDIMEWRDNNVITTIKDINFYNISHRVTVILKRENNGTDTNMSKINLVPLNVHWTLSATPSFRSPLTSTNVFVF